MTRLLATVAVLFLALTAVSDTGPGTDKRFPPLVVPPGFKATLFACDPLIAYPSVIARGPRPGTLFVAVDTMTGLGVGLDRDEVRLVEDTDGDGHADKATVYAKGLNSVQGLLYHGGTLFVMHAPYLTAFREVKGKVERRDVLTGLGLAPEEDQIRLHSANGVVAGHDGWLYLALGDRGCDVKRPEGDRLVLHGGGVLRCRPDGSDLHVYSTGLRNIYDVALDEGLNVLLRDNENDGGAYKVRVCHSFFGADHGYPYHYHERPDEALPPIADLGLGSSAGGVCYLETQFPAEHRGGLFFCEWGRAVVRYPLRRSGATFAPPKEIDFAAGAAKDPYGFKPTDLVVDHDGTLLVSDWADGQRPRRGRGRVYRVQYGEKKGAVRVTPGRTGELVAWLDSDSHDERARAVEALAARRKAGAAAVVAAIKEGKLRPTGRLYGTWVIARSEGVPASQRLATLFDLAGAEADAGVKAQLVRAVADLADPVIAQHSLGARLKASGPEATLPTRVAALNTPDPRVQLEVVLALGRLRWGGTPAWLRKTLRSPDAALAHAAMWATRLADNWPAVLRLLDEPSTAPFRAIARRAAAGQYDAALADGLIDRLKREPDAARRREYADLLARVHRKPGPWTYWGFRPGPRPANSVAWGRTEAIEQALSAALTDLDRGRRLDVLRVMLREKVPAPPGVLAKWLAAERDVGTITTLLTALRDAPSLGGVAPHLEAVLRDREQALANRLLAASLFIKAAGGGATAKAASSVEDGPVLAGLLRGIGKQKANAAAKFVIGKLTSASAEVRAAALTALAELDTKEGDKALLDRLTDTDARARAAAVLAAGKRSLRPAVGPLLKLVHDPDPDVQAASLEAVRRLGDPRALPLALAALNDRGTAVAALGVVGELGGPANAAAVADLARRSPSADVLAATGKVLAGWAARPGKPEDQALLAKALAELHGGGTLFAWRVREGDGKPRLVLAEGTDARVRLTPADRVEASCEVSATAEAKAEFFTFGTMPTAVWLNGKEVFRRDRPSVPGPYPDRFEATLAKGTNRVVVRLDGVRAGGEFLLRFRRRSSTAGHERLTLAALSRAGNPEHGRKVFLDAEKSLCVKCHRVGDVGEKVGPDLTGLGSRFAKAYIVESILEPGRAIAPSYDTTAVRMKKGTVLTGIKVAETETTLTVVDNQTKKHVLARSAVEEVSKAPGSAMPDGLEKRLTEDEFVDLVSFLVNLKAPRR